MTITFTTTITIMATYPIKDSVPLYVFRVYWNYLGADEKFSTAMQGSTDVPTSDPQSATPYDQLTQEQVMGWVQTYTPAWMWAEYTDKITAWITAQYTPSVVNPPLPWSEVAPDPLVQSEFSTDTVITPETPIIEPIIEPTLPT